MQSEWDPNALVHTAGRVGHSVLTAVSSLATVQKDFFQGADLGDGNNYNPAGLPMLGTDIVLTTASSALMLNGTSITAGSLNILNNSSYMISNNTAGATNSDLILAPQGGNIVGANGGDAIYLGGSNSHLTLQSANGGAGTGLLTVQVVGNIDVAQATSSVDISASLRTSPSRSSRRPARAS